MIIRYSREVFGCDGCGKILGVRTPQAATIFCIKCYNKGDDEI